MRKRILIGAAAAALLVAASAVTAVKLTDVPPRTSVTLATPTPTAFQVVGTVHVTASLTSAPTEGGNCYATDGYDDIRDGAQVTVKDETGAIIALGQVDPGHVLEANGFGALTCIFGFEVTDVPEGKAFYTVQVANRNELRYTRGDLAQALVLTLGDDQ